LVSRWSEVRISPGALEVPANRHLMLRVQATYSEYSACAHLGTRSLRDARAPVFEAVCCLLRAPLSLPYSPPPPPPPPPPPLLLRSLDACRSAARAPPGRRRPRR